MFEWKDERFKFDAPEATLELKDDSRIWKPQVNIEELDKETIYSEAISINTVS